MAPPKGKRRKSRSGAKNWKFRAQGADAHEALDEQIASLTAWCRFLTNIKWADVPQKKGKPGTDKKPPPPPPVWPPA